MKILQYFFIGIAGIFLSFSQVEANNSLQALANDTISGSSTVLKSSWVSPNSSVVFTIIKPDKSEILLPATSDPSGFASVDFFGYHTKKAGIYKIYVALPGERRGVEGSFSVFSGDPSERRSSLRLSKESLVSDGKDTVFATVTLRDQYDNPVSRHSVTLVSSFGEESITFANKKRTDAEGKIIFEIFSKYPGVSTLTAFDTTVNTTIDMRKKIIYFAPDTLIGGDDKTNSFRADLLSANFVSSGEGFGPIHHFDISFPGRVEVNSDQSFLQITAKDTDGNTVRDYTGMMIISIPEDENASIPSDGRYTFVAEDLGVRKFDLALVLTQVGKVTIQVHDFDPTQGISRTIKGEKIVEVVPLGELDKINSDPPISRDIEIKSPVNGSEISSRDVTITGKAYPNTNIKIFDNDNKIGQAEVDIDGMFTFLARSLSDGAHTVYISEMDGGRKSSEPVSFFVDATPPAFSSLKIFPEEGVEPGGSYTVTIVSEPDLDRANIRVYNLLESLSVDASRSSVYSATLTAPSIGGDYPVDVELYDRLGNKGASTSVKVLHVLRSASQLPPQVTGVKAAPADRAVSLSWNPVSYQNGVIKKYRIWFGKDTEVRNGSLEVMGTETTAFVPDLENGVKYFFAVSSLNEKGIESELSLPVSATPAPPVVQTPQLMAVPGETLVSLSWDHLVQATVPRYRVEYGVESGVYTETIFVDGVKSTVVSDLINDVQYFFRVIAVDSFGRDTSSPTNEASAIPTGYGLKPIPSNPVKITVIPPEELDDTGGEIWWIIGISLLVGDIVLRFRRRWL